MKSLYLIVLVFFAATTVCLSEEAYSGKASKLEIPEISAIVNIQYMDTDGHDNANDGKFRVSEAELGFQGYLNPSIKGDLIIAVEQEYEADDSVSAEIDIEEAYISFLDLPLGLQLTAGRKLMGFGRLNTLHPHHWAFADTPLALEDIFGHHPWMDDGAEVSCLIPNPADLYLKVTAGVWNGKKFGHDHEEHADAHEEEHDEGEHEEHAHGGTIEWSGHVFTGRIFADLPLTDRLSSQLGYSIALDEGDVNTLQGADFVVKYQWPQTYRKVKWHSEWFNAENDEHDTDSSGLLSLLQFTLNKQWEFGGRYDWLEAKDDHEDDEWAGCGFLTYFVSHTTYIRGQYQFKEHSDGEEENILTAQVVWGIGPHSHRISD